MPSPADRVAQSLLVVDTPFGFRPARRPSRALQADRISGRWKRRTHLLLLLSPQASWLLRSALRAPSAFRRPVTVPICGWTSPGEDAHRRSGGDVEHGPLGAAWNAGSLGPAGDLRVPACQHELLVPWARTPMSRSNAWVALVLAAGCFGVDTTLSSFVLRRLRVADLFVVETGVGAVTVWTLLLLTRRFRRPRNARLLLLLGLVEPGVVFLLFNIGLTKTSAVSAGLLASTDTLITVLLALAVLHERLGPAGWTSLAVGTAGTALVSIAPGGGQATFSGDLLVLAGSAVAASYVLIARRLPAQDATLSGTAYQLLSGWAVALGYAVVSWPTQGSALPSASPGLILLAVSAGILGTAIPFYLLNHALQTTPGSTTALILNLVPVFAVVSAVALLGETLMLLMFLGGSLILAGLMILARAEVRRARIEDQEAATISSPGGARPIDAGTPSPPEPARRDRGKGFSAPEDTSMCQPGPTRL
jgi:chloramphenicol-sensitive protein RarD